MNPRRHLKAVSGIYCNCGKVIRGGTLILRIQCNPEWIPDIVYGSQHLEMSLFKPTLQLVADANQSQLMLITLIV